MHKTIRWFVAASLIICSAGFLLTPSKVLAASGPAPSATLTAVPDTITAGENVLLTWHSSNTVSVVKSNFNAIDLNGELTTQPLKTTTYAITFRGTNGKTVTAKAKVKVTVNKSPAPEEQAIRTLYATMKARIEAHDAQGVLELFAPDYLHFEQDLTDISKGLQDKLDSIKSFDFQISRIDISGNNATVYGTCTVQFNNSTPTFTWVEPDVSDDSFGMGWLRKTDSGWRVYGNQIRAEVQVETGHNTTPGGDLYFFRLRAKSKFTITSVTVTGLSIPTTVLKPDPDWGGFKEFVTLSTLPPVGTEYTFVVQFADGTTQTLHDVVKSWVPVGPSVNVTTQGDAVVIHWNDVSHSIPEADYYWVWVQGSGVLWRSGEIPLNRISATFNEDGTASGSLQHGQTYTVSVFIFNRYDDYAYWIGEFTMP